jgi:hypothetical protein
VTIRPVTPGQKALTSDQQSRLDWVAHLQGGRDVIFAIDITESVGINDKGRNSLKQIIQDSLDPGDTVYIVPFASDILLKQRSIDRPFGEPIYFKQKDPIIIQEILDRVPLNANLTVQNTDIQRAELTIYQGIAQINQNRLYQNEKVRPQSIVWLTDAPLNTVEAKEWKEIPFDSPFRNIGSTESISRQNWLKNLNIITRQRELKIDKFTLTVVDLPPTIQESCTPAPGGKESCLVDNYLKGQLWLPFTIISIIFTILIAALGLYLNWWMKTKKDWQIHVNLDSRVDDEIPIIKLSNNKTIGIGGVDERCREGIAWKNSEIRGYIERRGNQTYLIPNFTQSIYLNDIEVKKQVKITTSRIKIRCLDSQQRDCYLELRISK